MVEAPPECVIEVIQRWIVGHLGLNRVVWKCKSNGAFLTHVNILVNESVILVIIMLTPVY